MTTAYAWMWLKKDLKMPIPKAYIVCDEMEAPLSVAKPGLKYRTSDKRSSVHYVTDEYIDYSERHKRDMPWPNKEFNKSRRVTKGFRAYTDLLKAFIALSHPGTVLCRVKLSDRIMSYDGYGYLSASALEVLWTYDATAEVKKFGIYCAKKLIESVKPCCSPDTIKKLIEVIQAAQLAVEGKPNTLLLFETLGVQFDNFVIDIMKGYSTHPNISREYVSDVAELILKTMSIDEEPGEVTHALYKRLTMWTSINTSLYASIFMNLILPKIPEKPITPAIDTWLIVRQSWKEYADKGSKLAQTHPYRVKVPSGLVLVGAEKRWFPKTTITVKNEDITEYRRRCTFMSALDAYNSVRTSLRDRFIVCKVRMGGQIRIIDDMVYATHMQILWASVVDMNKLREMCPEIPENPKMQEALDHSIEEYFMSLAPEHEIAKIMEMEWLMPEILPLEE